MNGIVFAQQWAGVLTGLGKLGTMSTKQIIAFNVWGFAAGIAIVWVYAAMRPRFGAGPKTAMLAGVTVWALAYALGTAAPVFLHLFPVGLTATMLAVELVETLVAGLAGAAVYKEDSVAAASSAARSAGNSNPARA
jgi:hypothetical protein